MDRNSDTEGAYPDANILSGDASVPLWDDINAVPKRKVRMAIYHLACKCQELEAELRRAFKRIESIERERNSA